MWAAHLKMHRLIFHYLPGFCWSYAHSHIVTLCSENQEKRPNSIRSQIGFIIKSFRIKMKKMLTMKDIAQQSNVSKAPVSFVLNGKSEIYGHKQC